MCWTRLAKTERWLHSQVRQASDLKSYGFSAADVQLNNLLDDGHQLLLASTTAGYSLRYQAAPLQGLGLDDTTIRILEGLLGKEAVEQATFPVMDGKLQTVIDKELQEVPKPQARDVSMIPMRRYCPPLAAEQIVLKTECCTACRFNAALPSNTAVLDDCRFVNCKRRLLVRLFLTIRQV